MMMQSQECHHNESSVKFFRVTMNVFFGIFFQRQQRDRGKRIIVLSKSGAEQEDSFFLSSHHAQQWSDYFKPINLAIQQSSPPRIMVVFMRCHKLASKFKRTLIVVSHLYAFVDGPLDVNSSCRLFYTREIDTCVFSVSNLDCGPVVVVIVWPLRMKCLRLFELWRRMRDER